MYFLRDFSLDEIDEQWIEHLKTMDALREGIGLQGYGQKDPKKEYKRIGFDMFREMMDRIQANTVTKLFRVQIQREEAAGPAAPAEGAPDGGARRRRTSRDDEVAEPKAAAQQARARGRAAQAAQAAAQAARGAATAMARRPSRCAAIGRRSVATIRVRAARARSTRSATARTRKPPHPSSERVPHATRHAISRRDLVTPAD